MNKVPTDVLNSKKKVEASSEKAVADAAELTRLMCELEAEKARTKAITEAAAAEAAAAKKWQAEARKAQEEKEVAEEQARRMSVRASQACDFKAMKDQVLARVKNSMSHTRAN